MNDETLEKIELSKKEIRSDAEKALEGHEYYELNEIEPFIDITVRSLSENGVKSSLFKDL
ncbi:hypothetical protein HERIO_1426 [Hepatospora eriocheir]|uniref:Uncharacterized protein n=1 Tax=Hepatospora eriocheir TaxID=1081669 RepID=A0A1X0QA69_9MICR|nr:hypothetical protein HERIO_1426 [Hepatospora eriocheir]